VIEDLQLSPAMVDFLISLTGLRLRFGASWRIEGLILSYTSKVRAHCGHRETAWEWKSTRGPGT